MSRNTQTSGAGNRTTYTTTGSHDVVFAKAKPIRGKDPALYRKDPYGNVMYKNSYGKTSPMGWQTDHIKPKSRNGSNDIRNLQALNSTVNMARGNTLVKKSRHSKTNK